MNVSADDLYRPCENPNCRAVDSTQCEFHIDHTGMVIPSQLWEAKERGCRVARFASISDQMLATPNPPKYMRRGHARKS